MKRFIYISGLFTFLLLCANAAQTQAINGTYAIKNLETGMLLRIKDASTANGTPLVSYDPVNWKCMTWAFKHKTGDIYQLQNLLSGKTFQPKTSAAAGITIEEQPLQADASNQQYEFIPAGKNVYLIRLQNTELYLSPADGKGTTNGIILLAAKTGSRLQQWTIYEQHPTM